MYNIMFGGRRAIVVTRDDTLHEAAETMRKASGHLRHLGEERRKALRLLRRIIRRHREGHGPTMEELVRHAEDFLYDRDDAIAEEEGEG